MYDYISSCKESDQSDSPPPSIGDINKLIQEYSQKRAKFFKIFPLLMPYLALKDKLTCALLNRSFYESTSELIWKEPDFHKLAHIHDALYMFNRFLNHIPTIRSETTAKIRKIDISNVEESLYDRVNPKFFSILVQFCSQGLNSLNLQKVNFFNSRSLPKSPSVWELPHLTYLNLSYCSQVNDDMIVAMARACRALIQVRLDGLVRHKGKGLAGLAAECDGLESVSVRYNTAMEDQAIVALAKFRHIRLLELDLTGCTKLTPTGFEMLARYAAHLTYLSLAETWCTLNELRRFICINRHTLSLNISGLKACSHEALADYIWHSHCKALLELTMDTATATALVELSQTYLIDANVRRVTRITLTNLPEHTPMAYLYQLLHLFPNVHHITFIRAYFETDFMLGTYREPSPTDEQYITDSELEKFNLRQEKVLASVIREREDNVDCSLLNW
jgi:hypothetical protein